VVIETKFQWEWFSRGIKFIFQSIPKGQGNIKGTPWLSAEVQEV
jgi:hypothetical protein